ncbi:MAG: DUF2029 domain-containing protein [Gemmataceae bacterium]|nr:DUF2029 domain-containing protein [Gemmataceae bacterium]
MDATLTRLSWLPRVFAIGVILVVLITGATYTHKALQQRSAFLRWREQILQLDDGVNIYERFQYPNPPIMALMLMPLAEMPPLAGALLWFGLKVLMAGGALWAGWRILTGAGPAFPTWACCLAIVLSLRPLVGDLTHGNVNILILFLVSAALFAYHRRHEWLSGILLALAICCKVTPLLFVPYFAWKRQWRVLGGTAVGMAAFLFLIPALALGWDQNLTQLGSWTRQMILPFVRDGVVYTEHPNQSLPGVAYRLLTESPSFTVYPEGQPEPAEFHNIWALKPGIVKLLLRGSQAAFLLGMILLCRVPHTCRSGWPIVAEFAFILIGMLILSERTWKHHCVTLAWPMMVLVYAAAVLPLSRRRRGAIVAGLTLALLLQFSAGSVGGKRFGDLAQVYGVYLWSFLILLTLIAGLLLEARRFTEPGALGSIPLGSGGSGCDRASG